MADSVGVQDVSFTRVIFDTLMTSIATDVFSKDYLDDLYIDYIWFIVDNIIRATPVKELIADSFEVISNSIGIPNDVVHLVNDTLEVMVETLYDIVIGYTHRLSERGFLDTSGGDMVNFIDVDVDGILTYMISTRN